MPSPYQALKPGTYRYDETVQGYLEVTINDTGSITEKWQWNAGFEPPEVVPVEQELRATIDELHAKLEKFTSVLVEKDIITPKEKEDVEKQKEREARAAELPSVKG